MGSTVFLFAARSAASCPYAGSQEDVRRRRIGCVPYHAMLSCLEASSSLESSRRILLCSMQKFEPWIVRDRDGFCGAIAGDGQKMCSECYFGRPKYFVFLFAARSAASCMSLSSRLGLRPLTSRLGLRLGLRTLVLRLGLRTLASRLGLRPLASRLGLWPLASRLGLRPLASRVGPRTIVSRFGPGFSFRGSVFGLSLRGSVSGPSLCGSVYGLSLRSRFSLRPLLLVSVPVSRFPAWS
jgi:hypothetical protein